MCPLFGGTYHFFRICAILTQKINLNLLQDDFKHVIPEQVNSSAQKKPQIPACAFWKIFEILNFFKTKLACDTSNYG